MTTEPLVLGKKKSVEAQDSRKMPQPKGVGYEVVCPGCCQAFHDTTERFSTEKPSDGSMFRLKVPYAEASWADFPHTEDTTGGDLACPGCGVPYVGTDLRVSVRKIVSRIDVSNRLAHEEVVAAAAQQKRAAE